MRCRVGIGAVLLATALLTLAPAFAVEPRPPTAEEALFSYPRWVQVNDRGVISIVDWDNFWVVEMDKTGSVLRRFGGGIKAPGKLWYPMVARRSHWGSLLVVDRVGVNMFSPEGSFLGQWRPQGCEAWTDRVCDLDRFGRVYIPVTERGVVERAEGIGEPETVLTREALLADGIGSPVYVRVDPVGRVYVKDRSSTAPLVVYHPTGCRAAVLCAPDDVPNAFSYICDIALSPQGAILVCSGPANAVLEYAPDGEFKRRISVPVGSPCGFTIDRDGNLYVGVRKFTKGEWWTASVLKLDPDGKLLAEFPGTIPSKTEEN